MPAANLDAGLSRGEAARHFRVAPHTVSMWALRGWRTPDGEQRRLTVVDKRGRERLYRYGDLLDAEAHTRRSPQSRRGTTRRPCLADAA